MFNTALFKKSSKYSAIEKWELSHEISVLKILFQEDPSVEENLTARFINIFIVLPKTASVSYMDENFSFYPKDKYRHLDRFQKLSYWGWDGKEIPNDYQIPFEIPKISNVVLKYTEPYAPGYINIEYSTENESFAKFTYDAMKAGLESKNIAWLSLGIAIVSLGIAIYAYKDSKNYQYKATTAVIEEKIAMMCAYNANARDFERRELEGLIDLDYTFKQINRDLNIPLNLISSYLKKKKELMVTKKEFELLNTRTKQLKKLIDLTNEFLNKLSEELKEKHRESIKEIENTLNDIRTIYYNVRSKIKQKSSPFT